MPATGGSLRILQVMRSPVGGLFRHVADLTRGLCERGHKVGLAVDSLASDAQTEGRLAALAPFAELGIHRFDMPRLLGAGDLKTPFAISALARRLDADILHGHGAKGGLYARLTSAGRSGAAPIYTPHGGVLHFSAKSGSGRVFHALERWLMPRTGAIVFESAFARDTYSRLIGAPSCPVEVIYNGVAPDEFVPVPPDPDAADFVFIGELRELKGIFPLAEAMAPLRRPDGAPATMVVAGDGPEREQFVARLQALGLTDRVTLVGSKPARTVFSRGRCAVVPSLAESLPYIVLEVAAAQLPLIATRVGGLPEIYGDTAGSLVPAGDVDALAHAMQAFLDDPMPAQEEMRRRLTRIEQEFSLDHMVDEVEALYRRVNTQA